MTVAPGITVWDYLDGKYKWNKTTRRKVLVSPPHELTAAVYVAVERAVALMWLYGITHSDFHEGNQMYDERSGKVTVIDFGQAVKLSDELTRRVREVTVRAIQGGVRSLGELWLPASKSRYGLDIQAFSNRVRYTRNRATWYNPDGHALMQLYSRMSSAQRALVPELRRKVWNVAATAASATAQRVASTAAKRISRPKRPASSRLSPASRAKRRLSTINSATPMSIDPVHPASVQPMNIDPPRGRTPFKPWQQFLGALQQGKAGATPKPRLGKAGATPKFRMGKAGATPKPRRNPGRKCRAGKC
jgi:hypothetical protein